MKSEELIQAEGMVKTGKKQKRGKVVKRVIGVTLTHLILIVLSILMTIPFLWMMVTAVKAPWDIFTPEMKWLPSEWHFENFKIAWEYAPFGRFYLNTIFVTVMTVLGQLIICSAAAYAFSRLQFPGKNILFAGILGTMMLPGTVMFVPSYLILHYLGWIDTYYALIVPALFNAFGIFLLRQQFLTIPRDLDDSAIIDGASYFRILWTIYVPLSKPTLTAIGLFTFIQQWNSFIWPLVVTNSEEMRVITTGLAYFSNQFVTKWELLMAGSTTAVLPLLILYFFCQKTFIEGITLTGLKY